MVGSTIKIRVGPFKGYRGRVVDVNGPSVRVELESQMKVVTGMLLYVQILYSLQFSGAICFNDIMVIV